MNVEYFNNAVRVNEATCPDKICRNYWLASTPNQPIICIPNKVVVKPTGKSKQSRSRFIHMVKTKISYIAILTALSVCVYYVESFLPLPVAIPGARWGFSNFPLLLSVVTDVGLTNTLYIALLKTLLGSILSGRFYHQCFGWG